MKLSGKIKRRFCYKTKNYKGHIYGNNVIASEYVSNPLLFKGRKFHLRLFILISMINNVFNSFLLKGGKIITAKEKFNMDKPFTKDVHDTHLYSTDDDYFIPKDFTEENLNKNISKDDYNILLGKIKHITKIISKILLSNKDKLLYDTDKNSYCMLGLDIIIRDNLEPVFIEINERASIKFKKDINHEHFSKDYFDLVNDVVLEPLFKYNDPLKAREHPTYINLD